MVVKETIPDEVNGGRNQPLLRSAPAAAPPLPGALAGNAGVGVICYSIHTI